MRAKDFVSSSTYVQNRFLHNHFIKIKSLCTFDLFPNMNILLKCNCLTSYYLFTLLIRVLQSLHSQQNHLKLKMALFSKSSFSKFVCQILFLNNINQDISNLKFMLYAKQQPPFCLELCRKILYQKLQLYQTSLNRLVTHIQVSGN